MADMDHTNDSAFDIEEDGADAIVADFIVSALDHVDGTQGFEEEARLYPQQLPPGQAVNSLVEHTDCRKLQFLML
jgi:hypothetical protein